MIKSIEGNFVNSDGRFYGRVEVDAKTWRIKKIAEPLGEADLVLQDELIFPGFVDVHVHAREDASGSQTYKEDFQSAGQAALRGGVVCAADMPNNPILPVDEETYLAKEALARGKPIEFVLYAAIGPNTNPLPFAVPYKVFMAPSVGDMFFESFAHLESTIARYRGQAVSFHCENPEMISEQNRPPEAETSAVAFAIELVQKYNLQGKICHCSTKKSVEMVAAAKKQGLAVTCEVTPHHLYFDNAVTRVNPPIRGRDDRLALIEALRNGVINYLASDHAPHTRAEKERGAAGMPHLDTYGAFATWLMAEHDFTPQDVARVCAYNPAEFVNPFSKETYGQIAKGFAGSFTIIDPHEPMIVRKNDLRTKCGWSPFEGVEFPGQVVYTIHKGKIAYARNSSYS